MKPFAIPTFALLLLAGCATTAPISEAPVPAADVAACEAIARQAPAAGEVATSAAVSGAKGYAIDVAIKGAVATTKFSGFAVSSTTSVAAGAVAPLFLALGVIEGVREVRKERARIVRECLRDRGHRVY